MTQCCPAPSISQPADQLSPVSIKDLSTDEMKIRIEGLIAECGAMPIERVDCSRASLRNALMALEFQHLLIEDGKSQIRAKKPSGHPSHIEIRQRLNYYLDNHSPVQ